MQYLWLKLQRWWWRPKAHHRLLKALLNEPITTKPFEHTRYVAIDLETTGLDPKQDEIASVGWVVIENGCIQLDQTGYYPIALQNQVGQSAVYHQLTDSELASGFSLNDALTALIQATQNSVLVFHNATLDLSFLNHYLIQRWGAPLLLPTEDTLLREKHKRQRNNHPIKPGDLRLFQCRQRYGLPDIELHDALGDALATAELWLAQNQ